MSTTEVEYIKDEKGRFLTGTKPGPGRPKSSRNKLQEDFVKALQEDFAEHGVKAVQTVRADKPDVYLKVIAAVLPKELNVNTNALGDMTDDELAATLVALRDLAATLDVAIAGAGAAKEVGTEPAEHLPPVH